MQSPQSIDTSRIASKQVGIHFCLCKMQQCTHLTVFPRASYGAKINVFDYGCLFMKIICGYLKKN